VLAMLAQTSNYRKMKNILTELINAPLLAEQEVEELVVTLQVTIIPKNK
jgi:hypothetical protein